MRLIDADELIKTVKREGLKGCYFSDDENESGVIDMIEDALVIDAAPVVHGKWITDAETGDCKCSQCRVRIDVLHKKNLKDFKTLKHEPRTYYKYCSFCGAKMEVN